MSNTESFFVVINPGATLGYSVWRNGELFKHGNINPPKTNDENIKIEVFFNEITKFLNEYSPSLIVYKNMSKSLVAKEYFLLQGMVMALCVQRQVYFKLVSLTEWKKALGCKAKKITNDTIAHNFVKNHYGENVKGLEAEAICIGASILRHIK